MEILRGMIRLCGVLCAVLLITGGTKIYEDIPVGFESSVIYQDGDYPVIGPFENSVYDDPVKELMIYNLLKNMQGHEMSFNRPIYKPRDAFDEKSVLSTEMINVPVKRSTKDLTTVPKVPKPAQSQPKWKNKIGKTARRRKICYFKICMFPFS